MKDKLNQFVDNLNGEFVEVSYKEALYQCMDLVYTWVFCLGYPKATIQHLYAYQVFTEPTDLTRQYFDLIPNTSDFIPQDGDIGVIKGTSGNIAGHIFIALGGGTTNSFMCFEQNNPLGTNAHIQSRSYTNVLGFLRPKKILVEASSSEYVKQLEEDRKRFWSERDEALKKVGDLTDEIARLKKALQDELTKDHDFADDADKYERRLKLLTEAILEVTSIDISPLDTKEAFLKVLQGLKQPEKPSLPKKDTNIIDRFLTFLKSIFDKVLKY